MKRSPLAPLVRGINLLGGLVCFSLTAALLTLTPARAFDNGTWTFPFTGTGAATPELVKLNNTGNGYALSARSNGGVAVYGSSGTGTGISGDATTAGAYGIVGYNYATSGIATGMYGATYSADGYGVYGRNLSNGNGAGAGVYGKSVGGGTGVQGDSTDGVGVRATSGTSIGVYGYSAGGPGVYAQGPTALYASATDYGVNASASASDSTGVRGQGGSTGVRGSGGSYGVDASASFSGGTGVRGVSPSGIGTHGAVTGASGNGVYGQAVGGNGVYGISQSGTGVLGASTTGLAGYFAGNVTATGTITGAVKNFKIDDPRDPARRYLVHASIESDRLQNLYSGKVLLNSDGKAVVQLPSYVETLNEDFQYQLTAVGAAAPELHVAEEVKDGQFTIAGGKPGLKVCWQVTGIRHDPYAEVHPMQVEQEKTGKERGRYLNPELYGKPDRLRLNYVAPPTSISTSKAAMPPAYPQPRSLSLPTAPGQKGASAGRLRN